MQELPQDVQYYEILSRLDPSSLLNYCSTNKKANETCDDPLFWEIYLKRIDHYEWEDLLTEISYKGNLPLFLYIYDKGTTLGHLTDLPDLETCYYYFVEQNFSEEELEKIYTAITSLIYEFHTHTTIKRSISKLKLEPLPIYEFHTYTTIKRSINKLKLELLPMLESWGSSDDIWTKYLSILLLYLDLYSHLSSEYIGDLIVRNTRHLDYVKFLSLDLYRITTQKWK